MLILNVFGLIHERTATKKDGSEFKVRFQEAEILRDNRRPRVVEISVPKNDKYEPGLYTLSAESFRPSQYDRLEMSYPTLISIEEAVNLAEKAKSSRTKAKSS